MNSHTTVTTAQSNPDSVPASLRPQIDVNIHVQLVDRAAGVNVAVQSKQYYTVPVFVTGAVSSSVHIMVHIKVQYIHVYWWKKNNFNDQHEDEQSCSYL